MRRFSSFSLGKVREVVVSEIAIDAGLMEGDTITIAHHDLALG
jgi:hypothetical protein